MSKSNDPSVPDPFDPAALRLPQDFAAAAGVRRLLTTVPVRKPSGQEFVRVHPGEDYRLAAAVLDFKADREAYLVRPEMAAELAGDAAPVLLVTAITRQGVVFLWPAKLPRDDGRSNLWHESALEAVEHATRTWVRVAANQHLGAYELFEATGQLPEPEWPDLPFKELLRIAFRDRLIDRPDHPAVLRLRGAL